MSAGARTLSWVGLVGVLALVTVAPALLEVTRLSSSYAYPDQASATKLVLSRAISVALVVAVIAYLRWWPAVRHEALRVRRWLWIVPATIVLLSLGLTDYGRLMQAGPAMTATLLVGVILVAGNEELLFRGVVLTFMRSRFAEVTAAVVTALVFGLLHLPSGVVAAIMTAIFGYLLYLTRRVSGGIVVPIVVHAAWDLAVVSVWTTPSPNTDAPTGPVLAIATLVLFTVVVVARGRVVRREGAEAH